MHNVCNVRMPHAMGDVISGIGIAPADSIGYRVPARYRSNTANGRKHNIHNYNMHISITP